MEGERNAYVWRADLELQDGLDERAIGAAVTTVLCGSSDHDGPCRWPHNNALDVGAEPARFRTVFVCPPDEEPQVRDRIASALASQREWRVLTSASGELTQEETGLGARLAQTPRPES